MGNGEQAYGRLPTARLLRAALAALGEASNSDIEAKVLELLGADGAEMRTDPVRMKSLYDSLASTKTRLGKRGEVSQPARGRWAITQLGLERLAALSAIEVRGVRTARLEEAFGRDDSQIAPASPLRLTALSPRELFALHPRLISELKARRLIRTSNLVGEYAERLMADGLRGKLAPPSKKGYDIDVDRIGRVQVKARMVTDPHDIGQLQLGVIRGGADIARSFDFLGVVLFDDVLSARRAVLLPVMAVEELLGPMVEHVNGRVLYADDAAMFHEDARDVTAQVRAASLSLEGGDLKALNARDWNRLADELRPQYPEGAWVTAYGYPSEYADEQWTRPGPETGTLYYVSNPHTGELEALVGNASVDPATIVVLDVPAVER